MRTTLQSLLAVTALTGLANAQFSLSEILINPPGNDDGYEAIEIRGAANAALTGYYILAIEGDGTNAGTVDTVINLGAYSTGSNGLLLMRDSSTIVLKPAPAAATTVAVDAAAFTPDIENGTITIVLGFGTAPTVSVDLDANNDGVLDNGIPGFTTVDAVAWTDGGASDFMYAGALGGFDQPNTHTFTPDAAYRIYDENGKPWCWTFADVLTSATAPDGPFTFDFVGFDFSGGLAESFGPQQLDLGNINGRLQFCTDYYGISTANGGTQTMLLDAGSINASGFALVVGSLSGTKPGIALGSLTIPVNFDPYTSLLLNAPNTLVNPSVGLLDAQGRMTSKFALPPASPATIGMTFNHAAVILDKTFSTFKAVTNPTTLFIQA
ncbi:MAG: hypothetical protein H6832_11110 [Planctomycetes bacterium]|nr:hypothetical protein [Planctomycetota bacterium]MCB9918939.1 hypothetical protein [Planctomycetota bacterium]